MKKSSVGAFGSFVFLLLVCGGFYYIYSSTTKSAEGTSTPDTSQFTPIEVSGLKEQALKINVGAENNAGIPLPVPTSKLGKTNPFTSPE